jgi:small subunit ribosomal protein S1|uniref:Ribosomal protein S1 n=1 Tax=Eubacterium cellulosolvens (strain ATCC 43171 / JCM 9499 / 6) TaxID=633697 RepID=I5ATV4_EUBC6
MADEMTMDDFSKAVDESFTSFKDEGEANWEKLKEYQTEKTPLTVTVDGVVNKGVISNVEGVRGFIPASRLALGHVDDLNAYLGKEIQVVIREVDEEKGRLILSAVELLRAKADEEKKAKIEAIEIGSVMDGKVESIQSYGAFIDLGDGLSGLVHISQISNKRVKSVEDVLKAGQDVKVKVIRIKDGKLSLSMKALEEGAEDASSERHDRTPDFKLPKAENISTNLGSLLKNIKLD